MKIGLMGGSFDPVHSGHLVAARNAIKQHGLDRVIFIPAAQAAQRSPANAISGNHRIAMLREAIDGENQLEVSDYELSTGCVSYTINTVRHFRKKFPDDELFWIIGSDKVPSLGHWRSIEEIGTLAEFIVLERPGHPPTSPPTSPRLRLHHCEGPQINISSTELKDRLRNGISLENLLPTQALSYVHKNGLYA